ncbi:hypothetical protein BC829DRAFT_390757, partial [Chytridium lagenaria]
MQNFSLHSVTDVGYPQSSSFSMNNASNSVWTTVPNHISMPLQPMSMQSISTPYHGQQTATSFEPLQLLHTDTSYSFLQDLLTTISPSNSTLPSMQTHMTFSGSIWASTKSSQPLFRLAHTPQMPPSFTHTPSTNTRSSQFPFQRILGIPTSRRTPTPTHQYIKIIHQQTCPLHRVSNRHWACVAVREQKRVGGSSSRKRRV